jgi:hypothetical protein
MMGRENVIWTCFRCQGSIDRKSSVFHQESAEFAVLFRVVAKWRAIQNKTTNSYIVEIAI